MHMNVSRVAQCAAYEARRRVMNHGPVRMCLREPSTNRPRILLFGLEVRDFSTRAGGSSSSEGRFECHVGSDIGLLLKEAMKVELASHLRITRWRFHID